jgi:hypothetical protein
MNATERSEMDEHFVSGNESNSRRYSKSRGNYLSVTEFMAELFEFNHKEHKESQFEERSL